MSKFRFLCVVWIGVVIVVCSPPQDTACSTVDDCIAEQLCKDGVCIDVECKMNSDCGAGKRCYVGECKEKFVTGCSPSGKKECKDSSTARECQVGGAWKETNCASDEECSSGVCKKKSATGCQPVGKKECLNSSTARECQAGGAWKDTNCASDEECRSGACEKKSATGCQPVGKKECLNSSTARECQAGGAWKDTNCASDQECESGVCKKTQTCTNKCTENKKQCVGDKIQICQKLASGCTEWGASANCPPKQICRNDVCVAACQDKCPRDGLRECVGSSGFRVCSRNVQGCLEWKSQTCSAGQSCVNGSCGVVKKQEGQACRLDSDCISGLVCAGWEGSKICTRNCSRSADCPRGRACYERESGGKVCATAKIPPFDAKCEVTAVKANIGGNGTWGGGLDGAPDPFVKITGTSKGSWQTRTKDGQYQPSWNETSNMGYSYDDIKKMVVTLVDEDSASDDDIAKWSGRWQMTSPSRASHYLTATPAGVSVSLDILVICSF